MPASLSTWCAHSYSRTLVDLFSPTPRAFRVFSTHTHACNLISPEGGLIALVDEYHGNGPFHGVIPPKPLSMLRTHQAVTVANGQLCFAYGCVALGPDTCWEPRLAHVQIDAKCLLWLHEELEVTPPAPLAFTPAVAHTLPARMTGGIQALTTGLQQQDRQQLCTGVQWLAGLGPGLTPVGDDFLLGFMAALTMQAPRLPESGTANALCTLIGEVAVRQTTRLSAAWLRYAAQGEFGAAWHGLAQALATRQHTGVQAAAQRILATGVTSGGAALSGFVQALTVLLKMDH